MACEPREDGIISRSCLLVTRSTGHCSSTFRPAAQRICIAARGAPVPDRNRATPTLRVGAGFKPIAIPRLPRILAGAPLYRAGSFRPRLLRFRQPFRVALPCSTRVPTNARLSPVFQMEEIGQECLDALHSNECACTREVYIYMRRRVTRSFYPSIIENMRYFRW